MYCLARQKLEVAGAANLAISQRSCQKTTFPWSRFDTNLTNGPPLRSTSGLPVSWQYQADFGVVYTDDKMLPRDLARQDRSGPRHVLRYRASDISTATCAETTRAIH